MERKGDSWIVVRPTSQIAPRESQPWEVTANLAFSAGFPTIHPWHVLLKLPNSFARLPRIAANLARAGACYGFRLPLFPQFGRDCAATRDSLLAEVPFRDQLVRKLAASLFAVLAVERQQRGPFISGYRVAVNCPAQVLVVALFGFEQFPLFCLGALLVLADFGCAENRSHVLWVIGTEAQ